MKYGWRDVFIFFTGMFSMGLIVGLKLEILGAEMWSIVGLIISLIFTIAWSYKSHDEREIEKQLKNARKIHERK